MTRWALLLLAGCDYFISLDRYTLPDAPGSCDQAIGHDEDGDNLDDACDPCPFASVNGSDGDGDGISGICDPDPGTRNTRLYFDGFGPGARPALTIIGGQIQGDALRHRGADHVIALFGQALDLVWVMTSVDVSRLDGTRYREIGIVVDASTLTDPANGTYCVDGEDFSDGSTYLSVFQKITGAGDPVYTSTTPSLPISALRDAQITGYHSATATPNLSCTFQVGMDSNPIAGTRPQPFATGPVGVYALNADVDFAYLFIVGTQ